MAFRNFVLICFSNYLIFNSFYKGKKTELKKYKENGF